MPVGITHSSYRPLGDQYERNGLKNLDSFFGFLSVLSRQVTPRTFNMPL